MNNASKKTILLVEDEVIVAMSEKMSLERYGYEVAVARTGEQAVEFFETGGSVDLILMDIDLGAGLDGTEAAQIILRDQDVPVIFLSSHTEPEIVAKTEKITSYGYVVKSSSTTVLDASIKMAFKLFHANDLYENTFEFSINGLCIHKMLYSDDHTPRDCEFIDANPAFEKITGLPVESLIGKSVRDLFPDNEADKLICLYADVLLTRLPAREEIWSETYGSWVLLSVFPMHDDLFTVAAQSITKQKDNLHRLRESEEEHRLLFETMSPGVVFQAADRSIVSANPAAAKILGLTADQMIGKVSDDPRWKMLDEHGNELSGYEHPSIQALETGNKIGPVDRGVFVPERDEYVWLSISAIPLFEPGEEKPYQVYATFEDITERKAVERELAEQTKLLNNIMKNMTDLVAIADLDGNYLFAGKSHEILGYDGSSLIGQNVMAFVHPEESPRLAEEFRDFLETGVERTLEYRYRCADGTYIWLETSGRFLTDEDDTPTQVLFASRNITERKQAERELAESVRLLSRAQEIAHIGVWQLESAANRLFWSDEVYRIFGCEPQEFAATYEAFLGFVHPDDRTAVDDAYSRSLREGSNGYEIEHRILRPNTDEVRYVHERCNHERDDAGTVIQSTGMVQDITQRKQAEEELRRFRTISDNAVYGNAIADLQGNLLYANRFFANIHGYEPEDILGRHFSLFHSEEQLDTVSSLIAAMLQEGSFKPLTVWHCHRDGTEFPMLMSGILLRDENGDPQYMAASAVDLSSQMQVEEKYRLIFNYSNDAIFVHEIRDDNLPGKNIEVNEQAVRLLGYTREELLTISAMDVVPENDASAMYLNAQELLMKKHLTFEAENIRSDGVVISVEVSAHLYSEGNRKFVVSSVRDITRRKKAERALIQKSKLLEESQVLADIGSWEWDIVHDSWHFSDQWRKIHGLSDNDLTTPKLFEIAHPDDALSIDKAFTDARERGKTYDVEHRIVRADDKEIRHIKALGEVEFDHETGRPVRMAGVAQDITERKQAENEIRQLLAEKETMIKEIQHRIKNNINTMTSLLLLQAQTLEEPTAVAALDDAKNRLLSLSVLYDHLYAVDARGSGPLREYLQDLVVREAQVFPHGEKVLIQTDIEEYLCTNKKLSTLGLIVNELVTNAMKHAFIDHPDPKLTITGVLCDEHYTLTVKDNGPGHLEPDASDPSSGFGRMIVNTLAEQLGGTIRFEEDNGTHAILEFPVGKDR